MAPTFARFCQMAFAKSRKLNYLELIGPILMSRDFHYLGEILLIFKIFNNFAAPKMKNGF